MPCGVLLFADSKGCRCTGKRFYDNVTKEGFKEAGLGCVRTWESVKAVSVNW